MPGCRTLCWTPADIFQESKCPRINLAQSFCCREIDDPWERLALSWTAGGDPSTSHKSPGRNKYEAITLERGLTQDLAFHDWAGLVWNFGASLGSEVSLATFRKDIYLEFYNEAGQLVIAYKIYR